MGKKRFGRQTPTQSVVLDFSKTKGGEALELYEQTGRRAIEWQSRLINSIMGINDDDLWTHQKFGFSVPRRNGKNEIIAMREIWGLVHGEQISHTAHRQSTATTAFNRLYRMLLDAGYEEIDKRFRDQQKPKSFHATKSYGLENIELTDGGKIFFRTRSKNGGLGEGFDLLIIDEAQEYTEEQQTALVYTVSDSDNPQTILCGTPPTAASVGTVFPELREKVLSGDSYETGWAEWSIPEMAPDVKDTALWYETNPSLGYHLNERKIRGEIGKDVIDFNIQRLGVWITYNQQSYVSRSEWDALRCEELPKLKGQLHIGIKYGHDGRNVAVSLAVKTADGRIFVECLGCRPVTSLDGWIISWLSQMDTAAVIIDGKSGQDLLAAEMRDAGLKKPKLPTVSEVTTAGTVFVQYLAARTICHMGQPLLSRTVSNCDKRAIGTSGGFGFRSLSDDIDISVMESMVLALWSCSSAREKKKQTMAC